MTMMTETTFNQWMNDHREDNNIPSIQGIVDRVECEDGFVISVQASRCHYCSPREDGESFYSHVECGFPTERPQPWINGWEQWAEDTTVPTETVYGWVPIEAVVQLINSHGGIKEA